MYAVQFRVTSLQTELTTFFFLDIDECTAGTDDCDENAGAYSVSTLSALTSAWVSKMLIRNVWLLINELEVMPL